MNYHKLEESRASMERFLYDMEHVVHPDRIVITGDLVHAKNQPSPEAMDLAGWFLSECARISIVVLILGNHDLLVENKDRLDAVTPIVNMLNNPRIKFYKQTGVFPDENINWVVYSLFDETLPVISYRMEGMKYFGLYHGAIQGAKLDVGFKFTGEDGASPHIFDDLDGVFCGDLHNRFVLRNNIEKPIIMVGSFTQQDYRENIDEHGYCIFKVSDGSYSFVDIPNNVKYMTFLINDIEDIANGSEKLLNKTKNENL
jgi:DNA repair exonuclease SbcCD nuclease subunit